MLADHMIGGCRVAACGSRSPLLAAISADAGLWYWLSLSPLQRLVLHGRARAGVKVLIVGIDGATFSVMKPLLAAGRAPELQEADRRRRPRRAALREPDGLAGALDHDRDRPAARRTTASKASSSSARAKSRAAASWSGRPIARPWRSGTSWDRLRRDVGLPRLVGLVARRAGQRLGRLGPVHARALERMAGPEAARAHGLPRGADAGTAAPDRRAVRPADGRDRQARRAVAGRARRVPGGEEAGVRPRSLGLQVRVLQPALLREDGAAAARAAAAGPDRPVPRGERPGVALLLALLRAVGISRGGRSREGRPPGPAGSELVPAQRRLSGGAAGARRRRRRSCSSCPTMASRRRGSCPC